MHPEDQYGKRALKAGAFEYMKKESAPDELIQAIRKILGGGRFVSAALAEKLAEDLSGDTQDSPMTDFTWRVPNPMYDWSGQDGQPDRANNCI